MVRAVKVFKKTSPNGKLTVYLSKRDFLDHLTYSDPIDGIIVIDPDYLNDRKVFVQVITSFRYGREEDEVMGVKFSKEMIIAGGQIVPLNCKPSMVTSMQDKLLRKFNENAYAFTFNFPEMAPSSVLLQPGEHDQGKPIGVEYMIRTFVGDQIEDRGHRRSTVNLAIKKLQHAPELKLITYRLPSSLVSKGFTFSTGKINLEVTLDKEIYYHGEQIAANVIVTNSSQKTVRNIKVYVVQHCTVTMVQAEFGRNVSQLETKEGCPITPGASLAKVFHLVPSVSSNRNKRGVALDGYIKDDDVNLASSTLVPDGKCVEEALGFIISYSFRVKLNCGPLSGELISDVPFKLLHPPPGTVESERANALRKSKSIEDDNIEFEEFARLRLSQDLDE